MIIHSAVADLSVAEGHLSDGFDGRHMLRRSYNHMVQLPPWQSKCRLILQTFIVFFKS